MMKLPALSTDDAIKCDWMVSFVFAEGEGKTRSGEGERLEDDHNAVDVEEMHCGWDMECGFGGFA